MKKMGVVALSLFNVYIWLYVAYQAACWGYANRCIFL